MRSGLSATPFLLGEAPFPPGGLWDRNAGFSDVGGRTVRSAVINPAIRNLVLIIAGQSNMTGVASAVHSPTNGAVLDNFNVYDGQLYAAADPLLGSGYIFQSLGGNARGCLGTRLGDALITDDKFDRVILAPVAIGGTVISQWADGALANRIPAVLGRLAARGIVEGPNVTFALIWGQGESDHSTSQSDYTAAFGRLVARARAAGLAGRVFVAQQTRAAGVNSSTIWAAQAACVDNPAGVFLGPDADAITAGRYFDNTHFDTAGLSSLTTAWQAALVASGAPF